MQFGTKVHFFLHSITIPGYSIASYHIDYFVKYHRIIVIRGEKRASKLLVLLSVNGRLLLSVIFLNLSCLGDPGYNAILTYLGVSPTGLNGTYF